MSQTLNEWRKHNVNRLVAAGMSIIEAVRIVERIIDNSMEPAVTDTIAREDVIDAMADWAVDSPIAEADILNAA